MATSKKTKQVMIVQKKSTIKILKKHKDTMRALGLKKINQAVSHTLTPSIQGMIKNIQYLVTVTII